VVRAPVSALVAGGSTNVRGGNGAGISGQGGVDVIGVDRDLAAGRVPGHVLVQYSKNRLLGRLIVGKDAGGAEESGLLAGVPVELDRVLGGVLGVGQDAQGLEDGHGSGAVVICAGGTSGRGAGGGVEMGSDGDDGAVGAGDLGDYGGLVEGVGELGDGDGRVGGRYALDFVEEPGGGLGAVGALVVAVVVAVRCC